MLKQCTSCANGEVYDEPAVYRVTFGLDPFTREQHGDRFGNVFLCAMHAEAVEEDNSGPVHMTALEDWR